MNDVIRDRGLVGRGDATSAYFRYLTGGYQTDKQLLRSEMVIHGVVVFLIDLCGRTE